MEVGAEVLLTGTRVDRAYGSDPEKCPTARRFDRVSYRELPHQSLGVMDSTAITLCQDNKLPIVVFNLRQPGSIRQIVMGEQVGTTVS